MRINTDGGPEFGRTLPAACLELGIEHRRLLPRSPDLGAFGERFQGSCLHLHYRVAFRYRYYASATDIDADLQPGSVTTTSSGRTAATAQRVVAPHSSLAPATRRCSK